MDSIVTDFPGFFKCFREIYEGFSTYLKHATYSNGDRFIEDFNFSLLFSDFVKDLRAYIKISPLDVILSVSLAVLFTILRYSFTAWIFKPLAVHLKLKEANARKFPESSWKCFYYIVICCYLLRVVVFSRHNHYFFQPYEIWKDYFTLNEVPLEVSVAFLLEFSYYLHSIYGTLCMDLWRKDSPVMLFHHLLCLLLIGFSYSVRYHKVGLLLMFVHDFADVFLEFSKCQVYMKYRAGRYIMCHDVIATISFGIFALAWLFGRLYLFPLIVIRSSSHSTVFNGPPHPLPFYFIFNILLAFMLALNLYWFILIMKFFYKVLSGQMKDLDDIRDYDVERKMMKKKKSGDGDNDDYGGDDGAEEGVVGGNGGKDPSTNTRQRAAGGHGGVIHNNGVTRSSDNRSSSGVKDSKHRSQMLQSGKTHAQ